MKSEDLKLRGRGEFNEDLKLGRFTEDLKLGGLLKT